MQPLAPVEELTPLYQRAANATARGSKSFYFASRFFPSRLAQAAHAIYWFCRTTDDIVDEAPGLETAARNLNRWEADLRQALESGVSDSPVLRLFGETVREYRIPHQYPLDLVEGVRMDLSISRYETFDDLKVFCYRVASVVGLMMMHAIGYRGGAAPFAADLGLAMQLTNILRDVGEDWRRGRVYLPQDELRRFGCSEADLAAGERDENFRRLMQFQCARARAHYRAAAPGIPMLSPDGRFSVEIASKIYSEILTRIEKSGYDVIHRRAVVPRTRKVWIAMSSIARRAAGGDLR